MKRGMPGLCKLLRALGLIPVPSESSGGGDSTSGCASIGECANTFGFKIEDAYPKIAAKLGIEYVASLGEGSSYSTSQAAPYVERLSSAFCKQHMVIPYETASHGVALAMANPLDLDTLREVEFMLGRSVKPFIADEKQIAHILSGFGTYQAIDYDKLSTLTIEDPVEVQPFAELVQDLDADDDLNAPTPVRVCNMIFSSALHERASDIHIEPTEGGLDIRFRVDGVLANFISLPKRVQRLVTSRMKLLANMDISEHRRSQDGRLRVRHHGSWFDIRASAIPTTAGEKLVLRILSFNWHDLGFKAIGMPEPVCKQLTNALGVDSGLILVTGPTGSGKTTTLYACLKHLSDGTTNITTVEDPVEYRIHGMNQIQVNEAAGVTFPTTLRSILRQDPDVILIGEIRDQETAQIAVQAAQTGHLVLATLHTGDPFNAIARMLDLGSEKLPLTESLRGIMAQRLVRKICPHCARGLAPEKVAVLCADDTLAALGLDPGSTREGAGCEACKHTGYLGRTAIYSYLHFHPEVAAMFLEGRSYSLIRAHAHGRFGYHSLLEEIVELVKRGVTSLAEASPFLNLFEPPSSPGSSVIKGAPEGTPHVQESHSKGSNDPHRSTKILIVDDNANVTMLLTLALQDRGYQPIATGALTPDELRRHKPRAVICAHGVLPPVDVQESVRAVFDSEHTALVLLIAGDADPALAMRSALKPSQVLSRSSSAEMVLQALDRALLEID